MAQPGSYRSIALLPLDETVCANVSEELNQILTPLGIVFSTSQLTCCVRHLLYVEQVNTYMNLTRITDLHDALVLHIVDSILLSHVLPSVPRRFLDMGTGAGFPGIPFHVATGASGVLIDSVGKKIDAVNAFIHALDLQGLIGVHERLEQYALVQKNSFDLVLARAVGSIPLLLEYACPFLIDDGYVLLAKARPSSDELMYGNDVAHICGLTLIEQFEFELPCELGHRMALLYQRVGEPQIELPRSVGAAKRSPLA